MYPASRPIHYAYPPRDGQAKLAWLADYISRLFIHTKTVIVTCVGNYIEPELASRARYHSKPQSCVAVTNAGIM